MYRRMHWFFKVLLGLFFIAILWEVVTEVLPKVLPEKKVFDSEIYGIQFRSESWEGTIRVKGDLIFMPGSTVKIAPGTRVLVAKDGDKFNVDWLPWHLMSGLNSGVTYHGVLNGEYFWDEGQKIHLSFGKLLAVGSKEHPIVFTSEIPEDQKSRYDFSSIGMEDGILSDVVASSYRRFEIGRNVTVRNSSFSMAAECGLCLQEGQQTVINNSFDNNGREDIFIQGASPRVTDNIFLSGSKVGVRVDPDVVGSPLISHNSFQMPGKLAIDIQTGDETKGGEISYNFFPGDSQIKTTCDSKIQIINNDLRGLITFHPGGCANTYQVGPNYWGTDDIQAILKERFVLKDPKLTVVIPQVLKVVPAGVGPRR